MNSVRRMMRGFLMGGALVAVFAGCSPVGPPAATRVLPEVESMFAFAAYPGAVTEDNGWAAYTSGSGFLGIEPSNYGTRVQRTTDAPETILAHYKRLAAQNGWEYNENIDPTGGSCGGISYNASMFVSRYSLRIGIVRTNRFVNAGPAEPCPTTPPPSFMPTPGPGFIPTPGPEGAAPSPEATPSPQPTQTPQVFWYIEQNAQANR